MLQAIRDGFESFRKWFIGNIYRGPVQTGMKAVGADVVLSRIYYGVITQFDQQLSDEASQETKNIEIGEFSASYRITTPRERDVLGEYDEDENREQLVLSNLFESLEPDDVFYDIGAHIGLYSCLIGSSDLGIDVVCFEPHPKTRDRLRDNLSLNGVDGSIAPYAMSGNDGTTNFDVRRDTAGGMGVIQKSGNVEVETRSLDSVVENDDLPHPTVIKADIAGEEINLIRGGKRVLSDDRTRMVFLEIHPSDIEKRGGSEEEIEKLLTDYGFDNLEKIKGGGRTTYHLKATKTNR